MSYILDALRRADAERERGGVPGLHTQAMPEPGDEAEPRRRGLRPWHWMVIGLAGGLALAVVMLGREDTPPAAAPLASPPQSSPPLPQPPLTPVSPVTQAAPATPPAAAPAEPVAIAPMRSATPAAARPASEPPPPAAVAAPQRVASLADLPADARAGLPALSFGGSIYSSTPANRLLIVNGQLMHEGDALGPGVTLEQIKPKAAVLNIRGQRYEVGL